MDLRKHLDDQARRTDTAPTEGQKAAGNYRKGRVKAHGLDVVIENACGATRSGKGPDGKPWKCRLPAHYGYIRRTEGADGDHVDVYVGPHLKSAKVFVVDQRDADTGRFDEHKVFFGFASPRHVLATYRKAFSDGKADQRLGALTEMTVDQFKGWLKTGDTTKPLHRASGGRVPDQRTKMGRDAFLYLDSTSGRFAQCGTCRFGHERCAIMSGAKVDPENGSCGFYIKGAPLGHPIANMTKAEVGYVDHPVRCENCRYFDAGKCGLYEELNREFPNQFDLDVAVHPHACCNAQMPRGRASGGRVGYAEGGDVVDLGGDGNFLTRLGEMEFSPGTTFGNRLFGTGGEDRYQTWPEKMIRSGASLPGDVAAGKFDTQPSVPGQWSDEDEARRLLDQQELLARAQDTAGMAGGTAFGAADSSVASLGSGPVRRATVAAEESALPFFSAVERAVGDIKQPKMTGDQWLGTLSNKPGVKAEELQWTGLAEFLGERKGQPVTKQEIAEHLADNQVRLNEVWKGADPETLAKAQVLAREHGWESWDALSPVDRQRYMQRVRGNRLTDEVPGDTKYHQYQLPGGENYREMLMTLPKTEGPFGNAAYDAANAMGRALHEKYGNGWRLKAAPEELAKMESLEARGEMRSPDYRSGHWEEPNILAHMRMNDRTIDGKRALHLEEIQSDWGQQLRDQRAKISDAIDRDFDGIADAMVKAGVIKKVCD